MTIISSGPLIGPVLRDLRIAGGITQQELENRTGVALSQISTYETSRRVPDLDVVARLAAGLGHRICILPAGHAIGQRERQAVIDAAKRLATADAVPIFEMVKDVERAVNALPTSADHPIDNPYAEIRELRHRLKTEEARVLQLREHLRAVGTAIEMALR